MIERSQALREAYGNVCLTILKTSFTVLRDKNIIVVRGLKGIYSISLFDEGQNDIIFVYKLRIPGTSGKYLRSYSEHDIDELMTDLEDLGVL